MKRFLSALCCCLVVFPAMAWADNGEKIPGYYEKSFTYETEGNYAAALNYALLVLQAQPDDYLATLRAGWLCYLSGNYTEAVDHYQKAAAFRPLAVEPLLGLILPQVARADWAGAELAAGKVLKMDPANYTALSNLAYSYFSQNRYGEAKKTYEKVLQLYPGDLTMQLGLAWTFLKMGKKEPARELFHSVLRVRKSNTNALAGLEELQK